MDERGDFKSVPCFKGGGCNCIQLKRKEVCTYCMLGCIRCGVCKVFTTAEAEILYPCLSLSIYAGPL